jgi:hypothetical protein
MSDQTKSILLLMVSASLGCTGQVLGTINVPQEPAPQTPAVPGTVAPREVPPKTMLPMSPESARLFLSSVVPFVAGRELSPDELTAIERDGPQAIDGIVRAWSDDAALGELARRLVKTKFAVGGSRDGINFDLPSNLAAYIVSQKLPWSTLLTADYCIDNAGTKKDCDSQAPFKGGGMLNTRAYLSSRAGRFNLTRASTMMLGFACEHYPMDQVLEPPLSPTVLQGLFATDKPPPDVRDGLGNSTGCYLCHSQFAPHAQVFVKFNEAGVYVKDADGLQDPKGEPGRSQQAGLMASHLIPALAADEASQMFGQKVPNLSEAAGVIARSEKFAKCQVQNTLESVLNFRSGTFDDLVLEDISLRATQMGKTDPTFGTLVYEILTEPRIQKAFLVHLGVTQ